jgi:hypothetical protein
VNDGDDTPPEGGSVTVAVPGHPGWQCTIGLLGPVGSGLVLCVTTPQGWRAIASLGNPDAWDVGIRTVVASLLDSPAAPACDACAAALAAHVVATVWQLLGDLCPCAEHPPPATTH